MDYLISGANYLGEGILIAGPVYLIIIILGLLKRNWDYVERKKYFLKEFISIVYIVCLGLITGVISCNWHLNFDSMSMNFIPFQDALNLQFLLNFLLFIPLGFILKIECTSFSMRKGIAMGVCTSIIIESLQMLFIGRLGDIDDVIANSLGFAVGMLLYISLEKTGVLGNFSKLSSRESLSFFVTICGILQGISYHGVSIGTVILYNLGIDSLKGIDYASFISIIFLALSFYLCYGNGKDKFARIIQVINIVGMAYFAFNFIYSLIVK